MLRVRLLVVFLLLAVALQAATVASDLVGRYHFIPEKSKGGQHFPPDTTLLVKQAGSRMYFEYWANNRIFQRDEYRADGKSEKLYTNTNETVLVDGRLSKNELMITTHHIIENEIGPQSFNDIDRWVLSKDGKTLAYHPSDGKGMLFERESTTPTLPPPPAAQAAPAPAPPAKK